MARGAPPSARTTCARCGTPIAPPRLKTCGGGCAAEDLRLMLAESSRRQGAGAKAVRAETGLAACEKCGRPVLPDGTPARPGGRYCSEMCPAARARRAAARAAVAAGVATAQRSLPDVVLEHLSRRRRSGGSRP